MVANSANLDTTLGVPCRDKMGNVLPFWADKEGQPQSKVMVFDVRYGLLKGEEDGKVNPYVDFIDMRGQKIRLVYAPKTPRRAVGGNGWNFADDELVMGIGLNRILGGQMNVPCIQVAQGLLNLGHDDIAWSANLGLQISGDDMPLKQNNIVMPFEPDGSKSGEFSPVLLSEQIPNKTRKYRLARWPVYIGGLDENSYQQVLQLLPNHNGIKMWSPSSSDFLNMSKNQLTKKTVRMILETMNLVTMNLAEANRLAQFLGISESDPLNLAQGYCNNFGLDNMVITADKNPVVFASSNGETGTFEPYASRQLDNLAWIWGDDLSVACNATGTGDSLAAGVMEGLRYGFTMKQSIALGLFNAGTVFCSKNSNLSRVDMERYTNSLSCLIASRFRF